MIITDGERTTKIARKGESIELSETDGTFHFVRCQKNSEKQLLKRRVKTCRAIIHWKVVEDAYEMAISINDVEPLEELRHELSLPDGRASAYHVSELSHVPVKPRSHRQLARLILSASAGSHSSGLGDAGCTGHRIHCPRKQHYHPTVNVATWSERRDERASHQRTERLATTSKLFSSFTISSYRRVTSLGLTLSVCQAEKGNDN